MRLASALLACLALGTAASARAQDQTAPTCTVATDPQAVSPVGILHVLDRTGSQILRFSLPASSGRTAIPLVSNADALAYFAPLDMLVIARASPPQLTLRSLLDDPNETAFGPNSLHDANAPALCGMTVTDRQVVVCVNFNHYLVLDQTGMPLSQADVGDFVEPNQPADPNAPRIPPVPVWDDMTWDGVTRRLYSVRNQGHLLGAFALNVDVDGTLGPFGFSPNDLPPFDPNDPSSVDPNAPRSPQTLAPVDDGSRLIAPDGLQITTDPFQITVFPQLAKAQLFAIAGQVFTLGSAVGTHGCALGSPDRTLAQGALVSNGPLRTAEWNGRDWLLSGAGAAATPSEIFPQNENPKGQSDMDKDHAPDSWDFFPLEPETGRDWDHDGVPDPNDAFPTNRQGTNHSGNVVVDEWLDTDGDKVGDNEDAFPNDPNEQDDTDGDGVGDKEDACPTDPTETKDSDGDSACDGKDAFPFDPLEQTDLPKDGIGDQAEVEGDLSPFGTPTAAFQVTLKRQARLLGFPRDNATDSKLLVLFDDDRFALCAPDLSDCAVPGTAPSGRVTGRNKRGSRLKIELDRLTKSKLEPVFAQIGTELVAADTADPPSPTLTFYPQKRVPSQGTITLGKKGASLGLEVDFRFGRGTDRGARGSFVYKAKGPPVLPDF